MVDNPLHQRVFATDIARRESLLEDAFIRLLKRQTRVGVVLGAFRNDALVGVAAMVPPGHCQPTWREKLAMLPPLARAGSSDPPGTTTCSTPGVTATARSSPTRRATRAA